MALFKREINALSSSNSSRPIGNVMKAGDLVQRNPTSRWYGLTPSEISARGILLKMTYLTYNNKENKWRVMWSADNITWVEVLREDQLCLCNESNT